MKIVPERSVRTRRTSRGASWAAAKSMSGAGLGVKAAMLSEVRGVACRRMSVTSMDGPARRIAPWLDLSVPVSVVGHRFAVPLKHWEPSR